MPSTASTLIDGLGDGTLDRLAERSGVERDRASAAIRTAVPVLFAALARNASSQRGARDLHRALERDHDGSLAAAYGDRLSDLDPERGQAILRHVFGNNQQHVEQRLGEKLGLNTGQIAQLLKLLAPLILSYLAKRMQEKGGGSGGFRRDMQRDNEDARDALPPELGDAIDDILGRGRDGKGQQMGGCLPLGGGRGR